MSLLCFGVVVSRTPVATPAALLQCAIDTAPEPASATGAGGGGAASDGGVEWGDLSAVSVACVGRHCGAIMKACVGLAWEAKVDVPHWLKELENLKVLLHACTQAGGSFCFYGVVHRVRFLKAVKPTRCTNRKVFRSDQIRSDKAGATAELFWK